MLQYVSRKSWLQLPVWEQQPSDYNAISRGFILLTVETSAEETDDMGTFLLDAALKRCKKSFLLGVITVRHHNPFL